MNIKIGAKIKALRKRDDITQEQLAEALGVTNQAISRWESESGYPDIEYITPIANFFNVTTDYLFDHDVAEKRRKIDEYCEQYDAHARDWKSPQERVDMMRQALAEFPAEEKLLYRLATALYYKWCEYGWYTSYIDGYFIYDYEQHKSFDSWEEAVKIMEELLVSSTDDEIRNQCIQLLAFIYGRIGEKEKVLKIAEKCVHWVFSKQTILATALDGKDSIKYQQEGLLGMLNSSLISLAKFYIKDAKVINEAYNIVINLYKFIFSDSNYGFYNANFRVLYEDYAFNLIKQNKIDESFEALENAYNHAKMFDTQVYKKGIVKYTAPFVDMLENNSDENYVVKQVPILLENLKGGNNLFVKLHDNPRFTALINKIEKGSE